MPVDGTVPRCAFWVSAAAFACHGSDGDQKEQQSHTEVCLGRPGFGASIGSNVGIGPRLRAQALHRQVPVETDEQLSLHPPLRGRPANGRLAPFSLRLGW